MTYIIVFLCRRSWKAHMDCFHAATEAEARRLFNECYRNRDVEILGVCQMPEKPDCKEVTTNE